MDAILAPSSVGYMLTADDSEKIHSILEDNEILKIVAVRMVDGEKPVRISLDDL